MKGNETKVSKGGYVGAGTATHMQEGKKKAGFESEETKKCRAERKTLTALYWEKKWIAPDEKRGCEVAGLSSPASVT